MAAANWQQANHSRRIVRKNVRAWTTKKLEKRSETDSPKSARTSEKSQHRAKRGEKSGKTIGVLFVTLVLAIFQWPYRVAT